MTAAQVLTQQTSHRSVFPAWLPAVTFIALATIVTRITWFGDPVADYDEQLYSFVGWRMTQGEWPFVDLWDRKPFGLFAIYAIAHAIGGPGPIAFQTMASLFAFAGAMLTYCLSRRATDQLTSCVAAALYLLIMSAYGSYSGQSEIFHVPLMLAMAWLVLDTQRADAGRRALLAMLLGGIALQIKYTVLPQCLFFGCYALWGQWRNGSTPLKLAIMIIGFGVLGLLPTVLVALFYAAIGQFDAFLFANFLSFFDRAPSPVGRFHSAHVAPLAPLAITLAGGIYAAVRMQKPRDRQAYLFYLGWAAATLATVLMPATVYLYYYAALAPIAALLAIPLIDRSGPFRLAPAIILLICWIVATNPLARIEETRADRAAANALTASIAPHIGANDNCLYLFDGPTVLYRLTGSCVPTRFVYPDHLNNALEKHALGIDQAAEVARILATHPGAIVTADLPVTPQNPESQDLVKRATKTNYVATLHMRLHHQNLTVWIRQDLLAAH